MAYLQDFYPLDMDDSDSEHLTSELKYDDSDILLLDADPIGKFQASTNEVKIFRVIPLKYVWKIIDILHIGIFITCGTALIK